MRSRAARPRSVAVVNLVDSDLHEAATASSVPEIDPETLRRLWVDEGWTTERVGTAYGVHPSCITRRLRKWNITRAPREVLTEALLRELYWGEGLGLIGIETRTGVKFATVAQRMKALGIPRRPKGYQISIETPPASELAKIYPLEGRTLEDAAALCNVSVETFRGWLKRCGIKARSRSVPGQEWAKARAPRPDPAVMLELAVTQDLTFEEIARRHRVSPGTVRRWVREDGLVIDARDRNFGSSHTANDGHQVRSGYELAVDNWLSDHDLPHDYEPALPWPTIYNAPQQSDFRVGTTYIEIFGVTGSPTYDAKTSQKLAQYHEHGLRVIAIYPRDFEGETRWQQKLASGLAAEVANPELLSPERIRSARPTAEMLKHLIVDELWPVSRVAQHYGCSESRVRQLLRDAGVKVPKRQRPSSEDLRAMYVDQRMSVEAIVISTGWSEPMVSRWLAAMGVVTRRGRLSHRNHVQRPPEKQVRELYVERRLTIREAAPLLGVSSGAFLQWLRDYGIPRRLKGPRSAPTAAEKTNRGD